MWILLIGVGHVFLYWFLSDLIKSRVIAALVSGGIGALTGNPTYAGVDVGFVIAAFIIDSILETNKRNVYTRKPPKFNNEYPPEAQMPRPQVYNTHRSETQKSRRVEIQNIQEVTPSISDEKLVRFAEKYGEKTIELFRESEEMAFRFVQLEGVPVRTEDGFRFATATYMVFAIGTYNDVGRMYVVAVDSGHSVEARAIVNDNHSEKIHETSVEVLMRYH